MIKFRNSEKIYDVKVDIITWRSIIQLSGKELPTEFSDFDVLNDEGVIVDYFEGFDVVYDSGDGYVQLTNDKNIYYDYLVCNENGYVSSSIVTVKESDEYGYLYQSGQGKKYKIFSMDLYNEDNFFLYKIENGELLNTSDEELEAYLVEKAERELEIAKANFENNKEKKIAESKILLGVYLETHPLTSNCHSGVEAQYNVTTEKQSLMASNYLTYTIAKQSGVKNATLTWNATGCECEEWTEEEFVTLVLQISEYVKPLVSLQQSYEVAIRNCTTQDELDSIQIIYDVYGVDD